MPVEKCMDINLQWDGTSRKGNLKLNLSQNLTYYRVYAIHFVSCQLLYHTKRFWYRYSETVWTGRIRIQADQKILLRLNRSAHSECQKKSTQRNLDLKRNKPRITQSVQVPFKLDQTFRLKQKKKKGRHHISCCIFRLNWRD